MLGNIHHESWLNPGEWQKSDGNLDKGGYGIVQWDPSRRFFEWADITGINNDIIETANKMAMDNATQLMNLQLEFLLYACQPAQREWLAGMGVSTYNFPYHMTFNDFISSTNDMGELVAVFNGHYERSTDAANGNNTLRIEHANYWYDYFKNWK